MLCRDVESNDLSQNLCSFDLSFLVSSKEYTHAFMSELCRSKWSSIAANHQSKANEDCLRSPIISDWRGRCLKVFAHHSVDRISADESKEIGAPFIQTKKVDETGSGLFHTNSAYFSVCKFIECSQRSFLVHPKTSLQLILAQALIDRPHEW